LQRSLPEYFPKINHDYAWVQNPFVIMAKAVGFNAHNYERLTGLVSNSDLKQKYRCLNII
jgi:hypothetical protein